MEVHVICLESTRETRCGATLRSLRLCGDALKVVPFKAITPCTMNKYTDVHPFAKHTIERHSRRWTTSQLNSWEQAACALSHIELWKLCVKKNQPIVIAEDDTSTLSLCHITQTLQSLPLNTDVAILSCSPIAYHRASAKKNGVWHKVSNFSGLQCYFMTPDGAKKLLRHALPVTLQVDVYLSTCIQTENLVVYGLKNSGTWRNIRDDSTLGHNFMETKMAWYVVGLTSLSIVMVGAIVFGIVMRFRKCQKTRRL